MLKLRFLLCVLAALPVLAQTPVAITLDPAGAFRVDGWADAGKLPAGQWPQFFSVQVDTPDVPSLLGSYSFSQGALIFVPEYPLQPGLTYRVTLKIPGQQPIVQRFAIPRGDTTPTTVVERVYPSTNVLPENQLKFYIHFSASMSRGEAYRRIHLLDERGQLVARPFLELTEELWDQDLRRFTLFFDPGRIKRGLVPHNELGMPIEEGRKYTLVIDRAWPDADNNLLKEEFRKSFTVGPADRKALDLSEWRVVAPKSRMSEPVAVEFSEPLDHALLERELEVIDASGSRVEGSVEIDRNETRWRFIPSSPWKSGDYSISVGTVIADLAGNMVDHPFEVDVLDKVDVARETRELPFSIN